MVQVTYEAVKRQLELLGHDVPDDAIRAYLTDLQKGAIEDSGPSRPASQLSGHSAHFAVRIVPKCPSNGVCTVQQQSCVAAH